MKGFFWVAACGLAAAGGVAIQNGGMISEVVTEIAEHESVSIDIGDDGDVIVQRSEIGANADEAAAAADEAEAAIDEAVEALTLAQNRIAEIQADAEMTDEERAAALATAQEERNVALAALRDTQAESNDAEDQFLTGLEQTIQGGITALADSDVEIQRDGEVLTGEEREAAIAEIRQEIRDEIREAVRN